MAFNSLCRWPSQRRRNTWTQAQVNSPVVVMRDPGFQNRANVLSKRHHKIHTLATVASFYSFLEEVGPIRREHLDWKTGDLFRNWSDTVPVLKTWITKLCSLSLSEITIIILSWITKVTAFALLLGKRRLAPLGQTTVGLRSRLLLIYPRTLDRLKANRRLVGDLDLTRRRRRCALCARLQRNEVSPVLGRARQTAGRMIARGMTKEVSFEPAGGSI